MIAGWQRAKDKDKDKDKKDKYPNAGRQFRQLQRRRGANTQ